MSEFSDLTKAPITYKAPDKTYELSPLTLTDWGQYHRWLQFAPWQSLNSNREKLGIGEKQLSQTLQECARKPIGFQSSEFFDSLDTADGAVELVYLSLRHKQPDVTREELPLAGTTHIMNMLSLVVLISDVNPDPEDVKKKLTSRLESLRALGLVI